SRARLYVAAVIFAGVALLAGFVPYATFDRPILFLFLMLLASATAALKVTLPLTTSGSTMSVSYAIDFASLLLRGPRVQAAGGPGLGRSDDGGRAPAGRGGDGIFLPEHGPHRHRDRALDARI